MANLGGTFDASQVDPSKPQDPVPPGEYRVQIINSEMRVTKAGTGQYLWLEMDILDGTCAGRKVHDRLNLVNPNAQAVEISQRTLSAICHATGRMQVKDSEELHFQPLLVKVAVSKTGYNEVKGYKAAANLPPDRPQASPPVQQQPQAAPSVQQQPQAVPQVQPSQPATQQAAPTAPPANAEGNGPWRRMG
ncbi:MAG: DUF669 domain-containing protein [Magnetococcales bacterium]|nr:DUF669 domain-containing protein [Magnetococcales bacterium]